MKAGTAFFTDDALVLTYIANHVGVRQQQIARKLGISHSKVQRSVRALVAAGYLQSEPRGRNASVYHINMSATFDTPFGATPIAVMIGAVLSAVPHPITAPASASTSSPSAPTD